MLRMKSSKFLADMLQVMRVQYRDAMFPDPARDFGVMPARWLRGRRCCVETSRMPASLMYIVLFKYTCLYGNDCYC